MGAFRTYQIIRSVNDLPPRDIKVFPLLNPIDINLVQLHNEIAIDILIDNQHASTDLTIVINDQDGFTLKSNDAWGSSDVLIERFRISGHTTGHVIVHVISITLLERLNALEVR